MNKLKNVKQVFNRLVFSLVFMVFATQFLHAQAVEQVAQTNNELLKVMFIILVVWFGIGLYLFLIDRKISKLQKELSEYEK